MDKEELDLLSDDSDDLPPSSQAVKKAVNKINNPPAKKKYKRSTKPLPFNPQFLSFPKNYSCITIEDELILKEGAGPEFSIGESYEAAVSIRTLDKDNNSSNVYYLKEFTLDQIRDITKTMAIPNFSKLNTFQSRHAIASLVLRTQALLKTPELAQLRPPDIATKLRYNTIVRMINVLFSEKYLPAYLASNDNKSREDIETGVGGTMNRFWTHLCEEMTNSTLQVDNNDENRGVQVDPYKLIFAESIDNKSFLEKVEEADLDPSDFTATTGIVLSGWEKELRKVRQIVIENMTTSGTHESDIFKFIRVGLNAYNKTKLLGIFPAYYFCLKAGSCTEFDSKFQPFMNDELKGESTKKMKYTKRKASSTDSLLDLKDFKASMDKVVNYQEKSLEINERAAEINERVANETIENSILKKIETMQSILDKIDPATEPERYNKYKEKIETLESQLFA
jgi:hypothetical protein